MSEEMSNYLYVGLFVLMIGGWLGHVLTIKYLFKGEK